jgi:hypothetical protein
MHFGDDHTFLSLTGFTRPSFLKLTDILFDGPESLDRFGQVDYTSFMSVVNASASSFV